MPDRPSLAPRRASGARPLVGRVLVVEDHDAMLEALRDLLEDAGYVVFCARDGVEALALLRRERISVMLLDLGLPVVDGHELRRRQLEDPAIAGIPVLVVTAAARADLEGVSFMRKPFDADVLLAELERLQAAAHRPRSAMH